MTPPIPPEPPSDSSARVLVVEPSEAGLRADRFLVGRLPGLGRREAARLFGEGVIALERPGSARVLASKGIALSTGDRLHLGSQVLALAHAAADTCAPVITNAPPLPCLVPGVRVVYEDDHLVVLAKPAGVPTHPLRQGETGTLANHLAALAPPPRELGGPSREAGIVHRLDTLTSGLLVAARTPGAYALLRRQFQEHLVEKAYLALVTGAPPESLRVDVPIESRRGRRKVTLGRGQAAETLVTVLTRYDGLALVEARTRFGRRHQVRAHLASAGHPLLGDPLYGAQAPFRKPLLNASHLSEGPWPLLHASYLSFAHPGDGRPFELRLALPDESQAGLAALPPAPPLS